MFTQLKICGITNLEDALRITDAGVNILGFNFFTESPRYIPLEKAQEIFKQLPLYVTKVGILVNPTLKDVHKTIELARLNALQIYEPKDFDNYYKIQVPVIHVIRMQKSPQQIKLFPGSDMILLDSFSRGQFGGTGDTFEWSTIPDFLPRRKIFLAGGINSNNIRQALEQVKPAVIDVASGCEKSPGKKDIKKVKNLVEQVYKYNFRNQMNGN